MDTIGGFYTGIINSPAITHTNLATAGHVNIIVPPTVTAQYQITGITLNGVSGTNFSGIGGDRDLVITDGTNTWSLIPAAIVQAFAGANAQWGSLSIPLPTAIDMSQFSVAEQIFMLRMLTEQLTIQPEAYVYPCNILRSLIKSFYWSIILFFYKEFYHDIIN